MKYLKTKILNKIKIIKLISKRIFLGKHCANQHNKKRMKNFHKNITKYAQKFQIGTP